MSSQPRGGESIPPLLTQAGVYPTMHPDLMRIVGVSRNSAYTGYRNNASILLGRNTDLTEVCREGA